MSKQTHIDTAQLAALFDGELNSSDVALVEEHVARCPACSATLEDMALTRQAVSNLPRISAIEDMWPCIEKSLDRAPATERMPNIRRWALAAAVAFLVGMSSFLAFRTSSSDTELTRLSVVTSAAPIDFGLYLASLDHVGEMPALPVGYEQRPASLEEALKEIGISDGLNLDDLPPDVLFRDASVITRGSSSIVQLIFEHKGQILLVLCQRDGEPVSFGRFTVETTFIGKLKCLSAYCGTFRSLCLTTKKGTFTVLGPTRNPRLIALFQTVTAV